MDPRAIHALKGKEAEPKTSKYFHHSTESRVSQIVLLSQANLSFFFFFFFFFFFCLFRAAPSAYGGSQASSEIHATAVATLDPEPTAPQLELQFFLTLMADFQGAILSLE